MIGEVTRLTVESGMLHVEGWAVDITYPGNRLEVSLEVGDLSLIHI